MVPYRRLGLIHLPPLRVPSLARAWEKECISVCPNGTGKYHVCIVLRNIATCAHTLEDMFVLCIFPSASVI